MLVEHMTGRIVGEGQIVLEAAVQEEMVIGPFGGEEGRCQVVVAAQHPDLHLRVLGHSVVDDPFLAEEAVHLLGEGPGFVHHSLYFVSSVL